jgi:hypothetical protein
MLAPITDKSPTAISAEEALNRAPLPPLLIEHVTVIDTKGGLSKTDMTVVVRGRRIERLSRNASRHEASNAIIVDGRGKFLMPGLWDMEVHLSWTGESALPLLVACGVTEVRDLGSDPFELVSWKTKITAGLMSGPHILQVGPMLNGKSFNRYQFPVDSPAQARTAVRLLKYIGVDGVEMERRLPRDSYFALVEEAKRVGLPVCGHVPLEVSPEEVSMAGQTTVEDVETLFYGTLAKGTSPQQQPEVMRSFLNSNDSGKLFELFARNHTAVTPAVAMLKWVVEHDSAGATPDPESRYVARSERAKAAKLPAIQRGKQSFAREIPFLVETVRRMHRHGVILLAGTDIAADRIPGFSLQKEVEEMTHAGLSPLEAIQTATINPAQVLKKQADFGSIEAGKVADMVLLDGDPLKDIHNIERISAVVVDGRLLRRTDLDRLLKHAESLASSE